MNSANNDTDEIFSNGKSVGITRISSVQPILIMNTDQWHKQADVTGKYRFHQKNKNGKYNAPLLREQEHSFQTVEIARFSDTKDRKCINKYVAKITSIRKTNSFVIKPEGYSTSFSFHVKRKYSHIVYSHDGHDYPQVQTRVFT